MSAARRAEGHRIARQLVNATWAFGRGGGYPVYVEGARVHTFAGRRARLYAADGAVTHVILLEGVRISKRVYNYKFRYDPAGPSRAARQAYRSAREFHPPTKAEPFIAWQSYLARCKDRNRSPALDQSRSAYQARRSADARVSGVARSPDVKGRAA